MKFIELLHYCGDYCGDRTVKPARPNLKMAKKQISISNFALPLDCLLTGIAAPRFSRRSLCSCTLPLRVVRDFQLPGVFLRFVMQLIKNAKQSKVDA